MGTHDYRLMWQQAVATLDCRHHSAHPRQLPPARWLRTQMERVLAINGLQTLSVDVAETARENLVIGHV